MGYMVRVFLSHSKGRIFKNKQSNGDCRILNSIEYGSLRDDWMGAVSPSKPIHLGLGSHPMIIMDLVAEILRRSFVASKPLLSEST